MMELYEWDRVASNNNSTPPDGAPETTMDYADVNDTLREGMAVHKRHFEDTNGGLVAGGTAAAYQLTTRGTYAALVDGLVFRFRAAVANTAGATLQINALAVSNLRKPDPTGATAGIALGAGDILADGIYEVVYDLANTQFVLLNPERIQEDRLRLTSTVDHTLVTTTHALQIGIDSTANLCADDNGLQARDNGAAVLLELQRSGGNVGLGPGSALNQIMTPTGVQALNNGVASTYAMQPSGGLVTTGGGLTVAGALAGASLGVTGAVTGASAAITGAVTGATLTASGEVSGTDNLDKEIRTMGADPYTVVAADRNSVLSGGASDGTVELPVGGGSFVAGSWLTLTADGAALTLGTTSGVDLIGSTAIADGAAAHLVLVTETGSGGGSGIWFRIS